MDYEQILILLPLVKLAILLSKLTYYDTSPLVASAPLASTTTCWGEDVAGLIGSPRSCSDHLHFCSSLHCWLHNSMMSRTRGRTLGQTLGRTLGVTGAWTAC